MKLKSYSEVKRRKGMTDELLESIRHGASGNGAGRTLGVSASTVGEGWKARSKELPDEFRGRDLSGIDVVAMMVDGIFPGKESCVEVALAIDSEGHKHLLDIEEGSSESAEVVKGLFARLKPRGLKAGTAQRLLLGILAFHRLNVPATLNVTFLSTNHIENVMRNSRGTLGKACRWNRQTDQLTRWMGVALLRAQEGFRRVRGHKELGDLAPALGSAFGACR